MHQVNGELFTLIKLKLCKYTLEKGIIMTLKNILTLLPAVVIFTVALTVSVQADERTNFALVTKGGKLYQQNCAGCHFVEAQGTATWRQRDADGKFPPPPLNGTGHTWHHPKTVLINLISDGTTSRGGNMPAWGDKLSKQDIQAILVWLQSKWPEKTYQTWLEIDQRSRQ